MPFHRYGISLPPLDIAPALLTMHTPTAPSPATTSANPSDKPTGMPFKRSDSTRLQRIKELLTPTLKVPSSPISLPPVQETAAAAAPPASSQPERPSMPDTTGSQLHFFARHPRDSRARNPVPFLDGGSGACYDDDDGGAEVEIEAWCETPVVGASGEDAEDNNDGEKMSPGEKVVVDQVSPRPLLLASPPPRDIPARVGRDRAATDASRHLQSRDLPRRAQSQRCREGSVLRARPATLHEMPGRFRSVESCWYCADWTRGARCLVCGGTVRRTCGERY